MGNGQGQGLRLSDIASRLVVAKSAVTAALQSLAAKGLLHYQPYAPVTLTDEGEQRAEGLLLRQRVMRNFLGDVLGLEPRQAASIACRMEHAIDPPALEKFICFLAFVGTKAAEGRDWLTEFKRFAKSGADGRTCKACIQQYLREARAELQPATGNGFRGSLNP